MKLLKDANQAYKELVDRVDNYWERDDLESAMRSIKKLSRAYKINCTGDAVTGDKIAFVKRHWEKIRTHKGKKINAIVDYEIVEGEIIKDSYGAAKQQHTFTILLDDGDKMLIKGRNLYAVGVWRKEWKNENERELAAIEKHRRGNQARSDRRIRIAMQYDDYYDNYY